MPATTQTISLTRPAEEVFARLADFGNLPAWDPMMDESTPVDAYPLAVGSRFHVVGSLAGASFELDMEIVVYEPSRRVALEGTGDGLETREDLRVAPTAEGCEVTYDSSFETDKPAFVDALADPAFSLLGRRTMKGMRDWLEVDGPSKAG